MNIDETPLQGSYDLFGWRMLLTYATEQLNSALLEYYLGRSDATHTDTLGFSLQIPGGWRSTRCVLGRPLFQFPVGDNQKIEVARRFLSYASFEFSQGNGDPYADIREIVASGQNERMALYQTFRVDQCVGTYKYNADTVFTLSAGSEFSIGFLDSDQRDSDAAWPFKIRFDNLPAHERIVVLPKTTDLFYSKWLMQDLRFLMRKSWIGALELFICNARDENGTIPPYVKGEHDSGRGVIIADLLAWCYIDQGTLPEEGFYGQDFEELALLLCPTGYPMFEEIRWRNAGTTVASVTLVDSTTVTPPLQSYSSTSYSSHASPLVRVVSAGDVETQLVLNTVDPATPIWEFASNADAIGQLVPNGRFCKYIPRDEGGVVYGDNLLTQNKAALLSSLNRLPVDIVRVLTGFALLPYFSTMVVLNASPTHYFKLAVVGNKLQLTFCYVGKGGVERVVAPEDTEWSVLTGGGVYRMVFLPPTPSVNSASYKRFIKTRTLCFSRLSLSLYR